MTLNNKILRESTKKVKCNFCNEEFESNFPNPVMTREEWDHMMKHVDDDLKIIQINFAETLIGVKVRES